MDGSICLQWCAMCWCAASVTVVRQALEQQLLGLQTSYDQIETKFNHVNKQLSTQRAATVISNRFLRNKLQVTNHHCVGHTTISTVAAIAADAVLTTCVHYPTADVPYLLGSTCCSAHTHYEWPVIQEKGDDDDDDDAEDEPEQAVQDLTEQPANKPDKSKPVWNSGAAKPEKPGSPPPQTTVSVQCEARQRDVREESRRDKSCFWMQQWQQWQWWQQQLQKRNPRSSRSNPQSQPPKTSLYLEVQDKLESCFLWQRQSQTWNLSLTTLRKMKALTR